jgi:hypothetical protein
MCSAKSSNSKEGTISEGDTFRCINRMIIKKGSRQTSHMFICSRIDDPQVASEG